MLLRTDNNRFAVARETAKHPLEEEATFLSTCHQIISGAIIENEEKNLMIKRLFLKERRLNQILRFIIDWHNVRESFCMTFEPQDNLCTAPSSAVS